MNTITILCGLLLLPHDEAAIWVIDANREMRAGFVVQIPSGSSDFVNVAHAVESGLGNSDDLVDGLPLTEMAVSVADFGSGRTFPMVGVFGANLALDASGRTPDLASPIVTLASPPNPAPALFTFVEFDTPEAIIPLGATTVHSVVQLPPGDPGLLQVGASQTYLPVGTSSFSSDAYATTAQPIALGDLGLSLAQDNSTTASCKVVDRKPHGRLRVAGESDSCHELFGDHLMPLVSPGAQVALGFFGPQAGDVWRLYFNYPLCTAKIPIGPVLGTLPDPDGDGSYLRVHTTWPSGFGGQTFRFSAAWGNPSCPNPGVGFTNCVTIITRIEASFGNCDDGTIESGWVVQIPSGSSDYFNNNRGDATCRNGIVAMTVAVLDFGTAIPAYPKAGVSNANQSVDPSGNTPDVVNPLALVAPFTFPALTFATTSGQYVTHAVSVPGASLGTNVHAWIQFPPGDSGLLGVGADTSSGSNGCSFFTADGYATPAVSFFPNWGIRLASN